MPVQLNTQRADQVWEGWPSHQQFRLKDNLDEKFLYIVTMRTLKGEEMIFRVYSSAGLSLIV